MTFPGRHIDTGSFIGTWPMLPSAVSGSVKQLPRTLQQKATVVGILREPSAGYDVDARSFYLYVDGNDIGHRHSITFSYGAPLPLSVVISQINSDVGSTVAFNDNGFLKLQSPTTGQGSYLKISTDPSSSPTDVMMNLGLFAETEAYAGDLVQTPNVDPDRQVATPGQMTMAEGESFEARVFNRALAQLSFENDRQEGLLSKKRVAVRDTFAAGTYSPGAVHGVQMSGGNLVYVGKASAPGISALEKLFAVLDGEGRELSKDVYYPYSTGHTGNFGLSSDGTSRQLCVSSAFNALAEATFEPGNYYLLCNTFTGGAAVLNGKPLKILEIRGGLGASSEAVIDNVNPLTGARVTIAATGLSFSIVNRNRMHVVVDGVFENLAAAIAGTPRLENTKVVKRSSITPTRIELGNRIVCAGEDFTASTAVQVGDLVTWSGATINSPYSNNGDYRVDKIIDKETIQVVATDWGAAVLNPMTTGGVVGTINITTDGAFVLDPFLRFADLATSPANTYPPPATGDTVEIAYLRGTTVRQATDDNPALFQSDVRFTQEADDTLERAIVRMWGPSVTSIDGVLYSDYRINLESVNYRLNYEHYTYDDSEKGSSSAADTRSWGRHKDIRPDTIDMWFWRPGTNTSRVTLRGTAEYGHGSDATAGGDALLRVVNASGQHVLNLDGDGRIYNTGTSSSSDNRVFTDLVFNSSHDEPNNLGGYNNPGERIIWRGKHKWYSGDADPDSVTLVGQHLITDLELTQSGINRFANIYGSRITIGSTTDNASWVESDLKFLFLDGALQKCATDYPSDQDAVSNLYGIHVGYTLSSNFKIVNNHYGLFIADIQRAGTAAGSGGGTNYAIYTGLGRVTHDDALQVNYTYGLTDAAERQYGVDITSVHGVVGSNSSVGGLQVFSMLGLTTGSYTDITAGYFRSVGDGTSGSVTNVNALWAQAEVNGLAVTNAYGLKVASAVLTSGTLGNSYGIYVDTQTVGSVNYAIYTAGSHVWFHDGSGPTPVALQHDVLRVEKLQQTSASKDETGATVSYQYSHSDTYTKRGLYVYTECTQSVDSAHASVGLEVSARKAGAADTTSLAGIVVDNVVDGALGGTLSSTYGIWVKTGTVTYGVVGTHYGIRVDVAPVGMQYTNSYGIYIDQSTNHASIVQGLYVKGSKTYGIQLEDTGGIYSTGPDNQYKFVGGKTDVDWLIVNYLWNDTYGAVATGLDVYAGTTGVISQSITAYKGTATVRVSDSVNYAYGLYLVAPSITGTLNTAVYGIYSADTSFDPKYYAIWTNNRVVFSGNSATPTDTTCLFNVAHARTLTASASTGAVGVKYTFTYADAYDKYGLKVKVDTTTTAGSSTGEYAGIYIQADRSSGGASLSTLYGLLIDHTTGGAGVISNKYGIRLKNSSVSGTITNQYALYIDNIASSSGTIAAAIYAGTISGAATIYGVRVGAMSPSGGNAYGVNLGAITISQSYDGYGIYVGSVTYSGPGAVGSQAYGLYIENVSSTDSGTSAYAIYTNAGAVYLGDNLTCSTAVMVGGASGLFMGPGTINVAGNIYKNGTPYTNPDYVFELAFTGKIDRFKDNEGALTYQKLSLAETEAFARTHLHLPGIDHKSPCGIFTRADLALEKIEELYLHLFEKDAEIRELKQRVSSLEGLLA